MKLKKATEVRKQLLEVKRVSAKEYYIDMIAEKINDAHLAGSTEIRLVTGLEPWSIEKFDPSIIEVLEDYGYTVALRWGTIYTVSWE